MSHIQAGMRKTALLAGLLAFSSAAAASGAAPADDGMIELGLAIIAETPDYASAVKLARRAAKRLNSRFDLKGLVDDPVHGLTLPKERCAKEYFAFPHYGGPEENVGRGSMVSVEFDGSKKAGEAGRYYVLAFADHLRGRDFESELARIRKVYPKVRVKVVEIEVPGE